MLTFTGTGDDRQLTKLTRKRYKTKYILFFGGHLSFAKAVAIARYLCFEKLQLLSYILVKCEYIYVICRLGGPYGEKL